MLFQLEQCAAVNRRIPADAGRNAVATRFALFANATGEPPDRRVVEQESLDDHLGEVHEVVVAADVCEFVREQSLELRGGLPGERAQRHEDDGPEPAEDLWRIDMVCREPAHRARDC